uniref:Integrase catalytic domain-containing protein n=1 Tax=Tanacetum cinerariifolium TaxID=118510 RepID=A0A699GPE3_TANCI|nr:hypothetical protein [Tanacetum cinerariifolium]
MDSLSPQVVSAAKLPILNPNEFDLWKIRIEQYFLMTDYSLWEVILNGDSLVPTRIVEGIVKPVGHTSVEQKIARKNELKAHGTLLMALPDKHQLKFNSHKDAKTLMEAIENSSSEDLDQIHDKLQKLRNKADLEEQSLNDLFNSLKIYETEVKHASSIGTATQNLAFVSSSNTDSTTDSVSAATSVSTACAKFPMSSLPNVDSLSNAVIYSFFSSESTSPQLDNEDLKQIDVDDLEEMDLRWQMAMLTMRARRFLQKTDRNLGDNGPTSMGFDMSKVKCYNYHRKGHFDRECRSPKDSRRNGATEPQRRTISVETSTSNALVSQCDGDWSYQTEEEPANFALMSDCESCPPSSLYDRLQPSGGYHIVPPPYTGTFMPPKPDLVFHTALTAVKTNHLAFNVQLSPAKPKQDLSHTNRPTAPIIEDWVSDSEDDSKTKVLQIAPSFVQSFEQVKTPRHYVQPVKTSILATTYKPTSPKSNSSDKRKNRKTCFMCKSVDYLLKDCDYHAKNMAQPTPKNYAHRVSAAMPKVNVTRPRYAHQVVIESKSPMRRHITHSPSLKTSNSPPRVTVVKTLVVNAAQGMQGKWGNPQHALKDNGIIDSGCSRHMTENMSYLSEFEELNGEYVAFGGNPNGGKIFGKGKIKTGKLDFNDVYFVKKLKFNLFSVSQMCDKKNSVLFTNTECLVLSLDFKFPDETQVLLRVPRENNMYNVNLKNIIPSGDLTCLFAKATIDESNLWHRRLGHINFKTINKLVKSNLVKGLPTKVFENKNTCVACKKGTQHRASCKTKPVSSADQPLFRLHMDLFRHTFVKSLNKKSYCLVITNDYSRFTWVFFLATKDETTPILKTFITGLENQLSIKGIKREFSVPRTPQQNGIAERKNMTLIEAARTMLADSLLPIPFWDEAVNTACYVQNRVLVSKPHNKTPYELLYGRTPSIGFMRPFGRPVTILNTLDSLGKFEGKVYKGFMVGYYVNSTGPTWLFDIDSLTRTMNYQPVIAGNQTNPSVGFQDKFDAEKAREEVHQQYVPFPVWSSGSTNTQNYDGDAAFDGKEHDFDAKKPKSEVILTPSSSAQSRKQDDKTKKKAKGKSHVEYFTGYRDLNMPELEDITYYDFENDVGAEVDLNNLETSITVSPIPTTRIHKDHPVSQIIGDLSSTTQTRSMTRAVKDQGGTQKGTSSSQRSKLDLSHARRASSVQNKESLDDIIFGATNKDLCKSFEKLMKDKFQMSSIGELTFFLGLQVKQKKDGIFISQDKYVAEILRKFGLTEGQTALGKEISNPFMAGSLPKTILHTFIHFWNTVAIKQDNDVTRLQALVDKKKVVVIEAAIREILWLDDAEGIDCLPNEEIFAELARMGYEKPSTKLTFYKSFFSSQWKFLIHTILQSMSAKRTLWNEFSSVMASVVICLSTGGDEDEHVEDVTAGDDAQGDDTADHGEVPTVSQELSIPSPTPPTPPPQPPQDLSSRSRVQHTSPPSPQYDKMTQALEITKLKKRVKKLEKWNRIKVLKLRRLKRVRTSQRFVTSDDSVMDDESNQGRIIDEMDKDDVVALIDDKEEDKKDEEAKVVEITATSIIIVAAEPFPATIIAAAPAKVAAAPSRRRKGVVIRDPKEESTTSSIILAETKSKDKGKEIMVEEPKPLKKKQLIKMDEEYARKLHEELNKDIDWDVAIDHVKHKAKEDPTVKRYQAIKRKPQTEAQSSKEHDNTKEQLEEEDNRALQTINETLTEKVANRRKLNEEVEYLKRHLEIMPDKDDDVYTEATPLARKNFDREDLEAFWSLVKERFSTSKPKNFSNDFLLTILGAMFEKPDGQAQVWKNQRTIHGQAKVKSWKLLESCGVHIITFTTTRLILLVERRYPLSRFTLEQMLNTVRLRVKEESKVSLELLRFTRQQHQEGQIE